MNLKDFSNIEERKDSTKAISTHLQTQDMMIIEITKSKDNQKRQKKKNEACITDIWTLRIVIFQKKYNHSLKSTVPSKSIHKKDNF